MIVTDVVVDPLEEHSMVKQHVVSTKGGDLVTTHHCENLCIMFIV